MLFRSERGPPGANGAAGTIDPTILAELRREIADIRANTAKTGPVGPIGPPGLVTIRVVKDDGTVVKVIKDVPSDGVVVITASKLFSERK